MGSQLYWEDVKVGSEIPPVTKVATTLMLVKYSGASGDFHPLHFDSGFCAAQGGNVLVHAPLKQAWLTQMLTDWIGEEGKLKKLACQFRKVDCAQSMKSATEPSDGETCQCKGIVNKKHRAGGEFLVDCDIWIENGKGEKTTTGNAIVCLPSRT